MGCVATKQENDRDSAGGTLGGVQSNAADEVCFCFCFGGSTTAYLLLLHDSVQHLQPVQLLPELL